MSPTTRQLLVSPQLHRTKDQLATPWQPLWLDKNVSLTGWQAVGVAGTKQAKLVATAMQTRKRKR